MDRDTLVDLINKGYSTWDIAKHFNKSQTTARFWLKKYSLVTSNQKFGGRNGELKGRVCSHCGETDPKKFYGKKGTICGKCHSKYTMEKGQSKRLKAIEYLGGSCKICGYNRCIRALDIHHLDPSKKDDAFRQMRGWSWDRIVKEIEGCVLLCKNCHAEVHAGMINVS